MKVVEDGRNADEVEVDEQESPDRVLVRPYIKTEALPPDDDRTTEMPLVDEEPPAPAAAAEASDGSQDGRPMIWLVSAGLALVVATLVTIVTLWPDSDDNPTAAPPPGAAWPAPVDPARSAASAATPSASVRSSPSPSTSPSPSLTPSSAGPSAPPSPPPSATLAPPPAADRVGPITGAGGDCLDVSAGIVLPGDAVVVRDCNGTLSQKWTVATDGTLRVSGSCANAGGSGQVAVGMCGDASSGQWRSGPGGSVVNVGSGNCLTSSTQDNRVRVAACGAGGQSWALP